MAETQPLSVYFDRSRWEVDQECRRKRYLMYEYQGRGIRLPSHSWELGFGGAWHEGAKKYNITGDIIAAVSDAKIYLAPYIEGLSEKAWFEAESLLEGLLRGWERSTARAKLDEQYEVVDTERELLYTAEPPFRFACRPDQILRSRKTGGLAYLEFKTTSSIKAEWFRQWQRAPQLLSATLAVQETYGEPLEHAIVQPIYKGWQSDFRLESPFVSAWRNVSGPVVQWAAKRPTSWKGWERVEAREIGYPAWLGCLGQEALDANFPITMPIYMPPEMVQRWWRQARLREAEIAATREKLKGIEEGLTLADLTTIERTDLRGLRDHVLDLHFPQNFKSCEPTWGRKGCMCLNACWLENCGDDPLGQGYEFREPHHEEEIRLRLEGEV